MRLPTRGWWFLLHLAMTAALVVACAKKFPTVEEQRMQVHNGQLVMHQLSSGALLDVWGPPTYDRREYMRFFTLEDGTYVPFFRVPLGEAPTGWNNGVVPGEAVILAYVDRGELLGFLDDRLVYREHMSAESLHLIGKTWEKEDRFKTPLEKSVAPRR